MKKRFILYQGRLQLIVLALLMLLTTISFAQQQITGKVSSIEGEALVGVNVAIKGTTRGTTSDADGSYKNDKTLSEIVVVGTM